MMKSMLFMVITFWLESEFIFVKSIIDEAFPNEWEMFRLNIMKRNCQCGTNGSLRTAFQQHFADFLFECRKGLHGISYIHIMCEFAYGVACKINRRLNRQLLMKPAVNFVICVNFFFHFILRWFCLFFSRRVYIQSFEKYSRFLKKSSEIIFPECPTHIVKS